MDVPSKPEGIRGRGRLFLVDDEPMVLKGLRMLVDLQSDLTVCGEAEDAAAALPVIWGLNPDLVVVDLSLKEGDGIELVRQLHASRPELRILVFSMHDETAMITQALAAGAHGYVTKEEGANKAITAIREVLQGRQYLSEKAAAKVAYRDN